MNPEPYNHQPEFNAAMGWIEVICGPMFSGKTEELIRRLKRAKIAKQKVEIFKAAKDTRYDEQDIVSHNENTIRSTPIALANDLRILAMNCDVVGIDEAQFLDNDIVAVCNELANKGIRVIVAGLDLDYEGKPFGPMPYLLAIAEHVTKLHAICVKDGTPAHFSFRKTDNAETILLGEREEYEPRSRRWYYNNKKG